MRRTVSAVGSRFPNEVSGTRSITLDLFLSSPYLRQTFTLFTTLLRARSGQLSFRMVAFNNDAPVPTADAVRDPTRARLGARRALGGRSAARGGASACGAGARTHLTHICVSMTIGICFCWPSYVYLLIYNSVHMNGFLTIDFTTESVITNAEVSYVTSGNIYIRC